ncbi:MAG: jacalin-like lectin [Bermanella sp.]
MKKIKKRLYTTSTMAPVLLAGLLAGGSAHGDDANAERALALQAGVDVYQKLTKTTWLGTHNSFANTSDTDIIDPNQAHSEKTQLAKGVRELVWDVHYSGNSENVTGATAAVRTCHNNSSSAAYECGDITGHRKLKYAIDDIKDWVRENPFEVLLIRLSLDQSAQNNINNVEDKLEKLWDYVYKPLNHGNEYVSGHEDNGAKVFPAKSISKWDILKAGKNIAFVSSGGDVQSDGGFNEIVFYEGAYNEDVKLSKYNQATNGSYDGTFTSDGEIKSITNVMTRMKDANTKSGTLGSNDTPKMEPSNIAQWLAAGHNIFEVYGFDSGSSGWNHDTLNTSDMAWLWGDTSEPNNWVNDAGESENCAVIKKQNTSSDALMLNDLACSDSAPPLCYKWIILEAGADESVRWKPITTSVTWAEATATCAANGYKFFVPGNPRELANARTAIENFGDVDQHYWVNYNDITMEGTWAVNVADTNNIAEFSKSENYGSDNGGSPFDYEGIMRLLAMDRDSEIRLTDINVAAGNRIDGVEFVYTGNRWVQGGTDSNSYSKTHSLSSNEILQKVEVCVDNYSGADRVFYMTFHIFNTNSGDSRSFSEGVATSADKCVTFGNDSTNIIAMHGREGDELDAIGFYARSGEFTEFESVKSDQYGGSSGDMFDDMVELLRAQHNGTTVTKINMSAGNRVDKVGFEYSDGHEVSHGGNGYDRSISLASGESITSSRVCVKSYNGSDRVFYLKFNTSNGRSLAGGKEEGTCTNVNDGGDIVALFGRAGNELDAIGFYTLTP